VILIPPYWNGIDPPSFETALPRPIKPEEWPAFMPQPRRVHSAAEIEAAKWRPFAPSRKQAPGKHIRGAFIPLRLISRKSSTRNNTLRQPEKSAEEEKKMDAAKHRSLEDELGYIERSLAYTWGRASAEGRNTSDVCREPAARAREIRDLLKKSCAQVHEQAR
jgi:hypothetical protein